MKKFLFKKAVIFPAVYVAVIAFIYIAMFLSSFTPPDAFSGFIIIAVPLFPGIILTLPAATPVIVIANILVILFGPENMALSFSKNFNLYWFSMGGIAALAVNAYFLYLSGKGLDRRK